MGNTHTAIIFSTLMLIGTLLLSCSTTSQTISEADNTSSTNNVYPSWYSNSRTLDSDGTSFHSYATAIDADSITSGKKAENQAVAVLESGVSSRLESIRTDAAVELGSSSGVDSPQFIIALRNAEDEVGTVAEIAESSVRKNDNGTYRGYAMASVEKDALIEELDRALSAHGNAWNALKESQAFSNF